MSCPQMPMMAEEFAALPENWEGSPVLLDSAALESADMCGRIKNFTSRGIRIIIHDLASPTMTRLIPAEGKKLQLEFQSFVLKQCTLIAELGVKEFTLSFDLERAACDPEFCGSLKAVLRSCFGILEYLRLTLLLNVYPFAENHADSRWLAQFRQDLLYPRIAFYTFPEAENE